MHATPIPSRPFPLRRLGWSLLIALAFGASACAAGTSTSAGALGTAADDASGTPNGAYAAKDVSASPSQTGFAGADASASADTSSADASGKSGGGVMGPASGASDTGIGLKPGGPQDIAYFRMKVGAKQLPKPGDMTLEGWLNEHDTVLPKPDPARSVDLHAMAALLQPAGAAKPEVALQIGLNSGKSLADVSAKVALTLVIDRSGSMQGDKIAYVHAGIQALLAQLPVGTRLSVVSFSSDVRTDWPAKDWDLKDLPAITAKVDAITADGGTDFFGGLQEGLAQCKTAGADYAFHRVIILSDGQPTEGNTSSAAIIQLAAQAAKTGCSTSTVGVGFDFDPNLMNQVAQQGDGTAWFAQDAAHAKEVFLNDLETMLLPVASNLWIKFKLASGWKVDQIYGFDWVEKDGEITVTGPKKDAPAIPDPGTTTPPAALPTLFASKKNGLVMVRLLAPEGTQVEQLQGLLLAEISYGYALAKEKTQEQFTVPVSVPGVVAVPDGGWMYFASPIVRRAFTLLQVGRALDKATTLAVTDVAAAQAELDAATALVAEEKAAFSAEELATYDLAPGFDDAAQLVAALKAAIASPAAP